MAVANSTENSVANKCYGSFSWGNCPLDILVMIFECLKPEDLMNCIQVNDWWRDAVNYTGQHRGIWPQLAQAAMLNKGVSFRRRSVRPWRDLYVNSRLWEHVGQARLSWSHERSDENVRYLHVYRDILIIEKGVKLLKNYYQIKDNLVDVTERLISSESNKHANKESNSRPDKNECLPVDCDRIIKKLVKEGPLRRFLVIDQDCYYALDEKNCLRCSKWDETNRRWLDYTLARYYGCDSSISDINVYDGEVYMLLKTGLVFKLDRAGRNFIPNHRLDVPTTTLLHFSRLLSSNVLKSVEQVSNLHLPKYSTGRNVMFHKACAVVSVPRDKKFKASVNTASGGVVVEYPELSCATQHGQLLFLGFKSGKVEISMPKNLFLTGRPEIKTHVRDCPGFRDENPEIVAMDVFEAEESHHLFIATCTSVYRLVITYSDEIKEMVGLRTSFVCDDDLTLACEL